MKTLEEIIEKLPENIKLPIYEAFQVFQKDVIHRDLSEIKGDIKKIWETIDKIWKTIDRVWEAIDKLTEAQKRTEERVNELAEAQKRTEQRVNELAEAQKRSENEIKKIWEVIHELAEAQKRTEKRVNELAEAQKRTEKRVNELAEAQKRTEQRVNELAEAQKRTEMELKNLVEAHIKLVEEHRKTREKVEGLSDAFGYTLEDRAIIHLPKILSKNYKIEVIGELERKYLKIGKEYIEVNIYGKGRKNGEEYVIIGEAKSRVSKRGVDRFIKKCEKISKKSIKIIVSYLVSPEIEEYIKEKGIILIPSYKLPF